LPDRKRVAVLTTGRQDYGPLRSTLLALRDDPRFELLLWAGGMHLPARFGRTVDRIRDDGLEVNAELELIGSASDPPGETARAVTTVAATIESQKPELLLLLGDRSETMSAGVAATLCRVPIAHLHGGEETEGAIDNAFRHALTKLSHLHLVSHESHARRVRQMGEDPDAVVVVGAPGLDNLYRTDLPTAASLAARLGIRLEAPIVVVTLHPATLGANPITEVAALSEAMDEVPATYVVTQPNADTGGDQIREFWKTWARGRSRVVVVDALGETVYWGLLRIASAVLGNSSSGIIEAPAAGLPVVNIGDRQAGRLRTAHVHDVAPNPKAIEQALRACLAPGATELFRSMPSHYIPGAAAPRIVEALHDFRIPNPPRKRFRDLAGSPA
jgi:UDP-hydrolysing UDP-N-acetyl-D-glucosamine 2-epimerase